MTLYCKSCGAPIDVEVGEEEVKCEYCKTEILVSMLLNSQTSTTSADTDRINKRLRRAARYLCDEQWQKALSLYEQVTDEDPENARAYIGLLLAILELQKEEDLAYYPHDLAEQSAFCLAMECATGAYKQQLEQWYNQSINWGIYRSKKSIYEKAIESLNKETAEAAAEAETLFLQLEDFEDSAHMAVIAAEKHAQCVLQEEAQQRAMCELREQRERNNNLLISKVIKIAAVLVAVVFLVLAGNGVYAYYIGFPRTVEKVEILLSQNKFDEAIHIITGNRQAQKMEQQLLQAQYGKAQQMESNGFYTRAWLLYKQLGGYADATTSAERLRPFAQPLAYAVDSGMALHSDGKVVLYQLSSSKTPPNKFGEKLQVIAQWQDIVKVAASSKHFLALTEQGTVLYTGDRESEISQWSEIVDIDGDDEMHSYSSPIAGLKRDGTVVAVNVDNEYAIESWKDVQAIACGYRGVAALTKDGRVLSSLLYEDLQKIIGEWKGIVDVATQGYAVAGIQSDGTVIVACASDNAGNPNKWKSYIIPQWSDIVAISVKEFFEDYIIYGLTRDGQLKSYKLFRPKQELIAIDVAVFANPYWYITQEGYIPEQFLSATASTKNSRKVW